MKQYNKLSIFTAPGLIAVGLLIGGAAIFFWFLWAIQQANAAEIPVRTISVEMHSSCADMPRGSQEMEDRRYGCFKELYRAPYRISRRLVRTISLVGYSD